MASPPVTRFLDFGQYKYELAKREKEAKRRQRSVTFKEVRLTPKIGVGDFDTKVHRAIEFLEDGDRIKVTVQFRGRELTHPELGRNLLARFADRVKDHGVVGAGAAPRGQVDAHHDRVDPQAEDHERSSRTAGRQPADESKAPRRRPPRSQPARGRRSRRAAGAGRRSAKRRPPAGDHGRRAGSRHRRVRPACRR